MHWQAIRSIMQRLSCNVVAGVLPAKQPEYVSVLVLSG